MKNSDDSRHVDISNMTKFQPKSDTNEKQNYPFTWESESREVLLHFVIIFDWLTVCLGGGRGHTRKWPSDTMKL